MDYCLTHTPVRRPATLQHFVHWMRLPVSGADLMLSRMLWQRSARPPLNSDRYTNTARSNGSIDPSWVVAHALPISDQPCTTTTP